MQTTSVPLLVPFTRTLTVQSPLESSNCTDAAPRWPQLLRGCVLLWQIRECAFEVGLHACYALHFMPEPNQKRTNSALWLGLLITVLGHLTNFLYYSKVPAAVLPWLNLAIPSVGLLLVLIGVARAFREPQLYGGKILGSIFTVLTTLLFAGSVWLFIHVRDVPRSAGAPQVGQSVPNFTLPDSTNQPVSLAQLFSAAPGTAQPKALLLVFYRGYW